MSQTIERPKHKEIHMTMLPQAEAILKAKDSGHVNYWVNKSVDGLPLVEAMD